MQDQRDRPIEITREMIEAGKGVLSFWLDEHVPESWYLANERVLVEVFEQMAKCSGHYILKEAACQR